MFRRKERLRPYRQPPVQTLHTRPRYGLLIARFIVATRTANRRARLTTGNGLALYQGWEGLAAS